MQITITAQEAAAALGINTQTVYAYIKSGRLTGDSTTGQVDFDNLTAYRKSLIPNYSAVRLALFLDDGQLSERERDILTRREQFEKLAEIGLAHGITKARVGAIIKAVLARQP